MQDINKVMKKLSPEFIDAIDGMNGDEIKSRILTCESNLYDVEKAKDEDEKLTKAKETAKELAAPYRENKSLEMAKIKYCLYILENRGINI
jgi:hypothetical protein